jgi:carboxymethylenebutenolidase
MTMHSARLLALSTCACLLPAALQSQAVARQSWMPVHADDAVRMDTVRIRSGSDVITSYVAHPAKPGRYPVVIVLHANRLTEPYIASTTQMLGRAGFSAIAVDLFHYLPGNESWEATRTVPGDTINAVMQREFREPRMVRNIQSAIDYMRAQPYAAAGGVGLLGFCGGGWNALIASAQLRDVGAVVAFYAPVTLSDVQHRSPMELVEWLRVPVQYHRATNDQFVADPDVDRFVATLRAQRTPIEKFEYEAQHGFFAWNRAGVFSERDANVAWTRVVSFLEANVGKPVRQRAIAPATTGASSLPQSPSRVLLHGSTLDHSGH